MENIKNILERANQIVNERSEEKDRQYGGFTESMVIMRDIFNAMTGHELTVQDMFKAMIAMKLARQRNKHKQDNLLDAVAYIGALDNYEQEIQVPESGIVSADLNRLFYGVPAHPIYPAGNQLETVRQLNTIRNEPLTDKSKKKLFKRAKRLAKKYNKKKE